MIRPSSDAIVQEVEYPHPIESVWRALTDSGAMAEWAFANGGIADGFAPVVGTRFTFTDPRAQGWSGKVDCEVLEVDPPRRLSYAWRGDGLDTVVTFVLQRTPTGTRLRLEHTGFDKSGESGQRGRESLDQGWGQHILQGSLRRVIEDLAVRH